MMTLDYAIQNELAQSLLWRFFALAFRYPTRELICALADAPVWKEKKYPEFKQLKKEFKALSLGEMESEFTKTFGHSVGGNAPAYEMEYGDPESFWGPHELADIGAFYRSFGVKVSAERPERVDHISMECEFMGFLVLRLAYALENQHGEEKVETLRLALKKFYEEHIGRWGFAFTKRLEKSTSSRFYQILAGCLNRFLGGEAERLRARAGSTELKLRTVNLDEEMVAEACRSCVGTENIP